MREGRRGLTGNRWDIRSLDGGNVTLIGIDLVPPPCPAGSQVLVIDPYELVRPYAPIGSLLISWWMMTLGGLDSLDGVLARGCCKRCGVPLRVLVVLPLESTVVGSLFLERRARVVSG